MTATLESRGYAALRRALLEHLPVDAVNDGPAERLLRRAADLLQLAEARENICHHDHGEPSLRDRLAMAALASFTVEPGDYMATEDKKRLSLSEVAARKAYSIADAMIEERKRER